MCYPAPVAHDDEDESPTPRETPVELHSVSAYEEIQAIASSLIPRWQRALVMQARAMLKAQELECDDDD